MRMATRQLCAMVLHSPSPQRRTRRRREFARAQPLSRRSGGAACLCNGCAGNQLQRRRADSNTCASWVMDVTGVRGRLPARANHERLTRGVAHRWFAQSAGEQRVGSAKCNTWTPTHPCTPRLQLARDAIGLTHGGMRLQSSDSPRSHASSTSCGQHHECEFGHGCVGVTGRLAARANHTGGPLVTRSDTHMAPCGCSPASPKIARFHDVDVRP